MSRRDAVILLADILEAAQRAARYARRYASFADFVSNTETVDAITRNLEIVGEASRMLPEDFKEEHREIPWRTLSGLRFVGSNVTFHWANRNPTVALACPTYHYARSYHLTPKESYHLTPKEKE